MKSTREVANALLKKLIMIDFTMNYSRAEHEEALGDIINALQDEREACAKIAMQFHVYDCGDREDVSKRIANAIMK